ncbi:MAG: hydantoinase B/oxoprolinase family protein [Bacteroidota bacterium]
MHTPWQISIDTGGTFSDCIAIDPSGNLHRSKVLSSGRVRAEIRSILAPTQLAIDRSWLGTHAIFAGYDCEWQVGSRMGTAKVLSWNPDEETLTLEERLPTRLYAGSVISLTAYEEAPTLAIRLMTGTPLTDPLPPMEVRLGTTKGTNALLEQKGAKVCLITNEGLADLLRIGTQARPNIFELNIRQTPPLFHAVRTVSARLDAKGEIIQELSSQEIDQLIQQVRAVGGDAIAISLLHAYQNPVHELRIKAAMLEAGLSHISCSHEMSRNIKLLPRTQTAVANAYLHPLLEAYLGRVAEPLQKGRVDIMGSAGTLYSRTEFFPVDSLLSGPAGGVVGAAASARRLGIERLLTLDMGGTSTDVARVDAQFEYQYETNVGDLSIMRPSLAIETVAAGGGSICWFDGQKLQVGPESAGAHPGPACYGNGGPLTITDVNLLAQRMDPTAMKIPISWEAAKSALATLTEQSGLAPQEILGGCLQIANEKMAAAIRNISLQKGYDPQVYTLLAFGGAGGQHACQIADLLGINSILIPYEAGILSAVGIQTSKEEHLRSRQLLAPWQDIQASLSQLFDELAEEAKHFFASTESQIADSIEIKRTLIFLRFKGQDHSLELPYEPDPDQMEQAFRTAYEHLYGHWLAGRPLEVDKIQVTVGLIQTKERIRAHPPTKSYQANPARTLAGGMAIYDWEELRPGARVKDKGIIVSPFGTLVIDAGWQLDIQEDGQARLTRQNRKHRTNKQYDHRIQLELFTRRFQSVAEEMGAMLERTSFSVNVKERLDFSCALLDVNGKLVVNAPHIPVHLGSLGVCVRLVKEQIEIGPGDVIITNHPAYGGSHLPDITLIQAVFSPEGKHIGYVVNRAHHAEVGGKRPGSMPPDATHLAEEGVVIPPTYLLHKGIPQWDVITHLFQEAAFPTRNLAENLSDLQAGLASLQVGQQRMRELCEQFGTDQVETYLIALLDYTAQRLTDRLWQLGSQKLRAIEYLDDGSPLQVEIGIEAGKAKLDFSGTASEHPTNFNANPAIVYSCVLYVLRVLMDQNLPLNEGLLAPIEIHIPSGLLNPDFSSSPLSSPAVVGGNVETSQRLTDCLLKAFGLAAGSQGTMNNLLFGNREFGYYETIGGGVGAGPGFDGAHAVHQHMTNTRITDPEILEFRYPVRLEEFAVREDSGGVGKWQGGNGIIRELRFLEPIALTLLSQHRKEAPYGLLGGESGKTGKQFIIKANGDRISLEGIEGANLEAGDRIRILTPGGGGYGNT